MLKIGDIRSIYVNASGLWWENRFRSIMEAVANIVLNFVLGKLYGVYGIIAATLVSLLLFGVGYGTRITFKYYFKNGKLGEYYRNHLRYAVTTAGIGTVTYWICSLVQGGDWFVFIVREVICCIIPVVVYVCIYYRAKVYAESVPWILEKFHLEKKLGVLIPKER